MAANWIRAAAQESKHDCVRDTVINPHDVVPSLIIVFLQHQITCSSFENGQNGKWYRRNV